MNLNLLKMIKENNLPKAYFDEMQRSKMRNVNIASFVKWYDNSLIIYERGNARLRENPSVVLNDVWARDFTTGESYTGIDFCIKYLGLNKYASMYVLNEFLKSGNNTAEQKKPMLPISEVERKINDGTYISARGIKQIYAYLCKTRKISPDVVKTFIDKGYLYAECLEKGYNLLFPIYNDEDIISGFERTGILSSNNHRFKGCIITEEYSGFTYVYQHIPNTKETIIVFESSIDIMSFLTLINEGKITMDFDSTVVLVSLRGVQEKILNKYNKGKVYFAVDNDDAGLEFYRKNFNSGNSDSTPTCSLQKYNCKDWNELLQKKDIINETINISNKLPF
ncbi:MAG: DUF3991 and TOPRIM domain-containing protein [Clostridia bacterium]|nr:DUF3991 and TOPRIM domain-containing protein [Clostridia bacterium]